MHRDIKTENILLSTDVTSRLADLGEARFTDETKTMTMVGTRGFVAPERMVRRSIQGILTASLPTHGKILHGNIIYWWSHAHTHVGGRKKAYAHTRGVY